MDNELQISGVWISILSCSNPIHRQSFITMIFQQICLKNKEYNFIFKSNAGLNYIEINGKMMGNKKPIFNWKIMTNYIREINIFISSTVVSQYILASDSLFASVITLITGSVLEG
jgi:hypothetical protein